MAPIVMMNAGLLDFDGFVPDGPRKFGGNHSFTMPTRGERTTDGQTNLIAIPKYVQVACENAMGKGMIVSREQTGFIIYCYHIIASTSSMEGWLCNLKTLEIADGQQPRGRGRLYETKRCTC